MCCAHPRADRSCISKGLDEPFALIPAQQLFSPRRKDVNQLARKDPIQRNCVTAEPLPNPSCVLLHIARRLRSTTLATGEGHMKCPSTAGCRRDVTSHVSISRKLVLAEQPKRWADRTVLSYKQALFFSQPNVVSCFNGNFQEPY